MSSTPECSGFLKDCAKCTRKKTDCPIKDVKDIDHHIGGWMLDMGKPEKSIKIVYEDQPLTETIQVEPIKGSDSLHIYGAKK